MHWIFKQWMIIKVVSKSYVDQFHQEKKRSKWDLGRDFYNESNDLVKNNQDNEFEKNKLTNLDSVSVNRSPTLDHALIKKTSRWWVR